MPKNKALVCLIDSQHERTTNVFMKLGHDQLIEHYLKLSVCTGWRLTCKASPTS